MLFVKSSREAEIAELDVPILISTPIRTTRRKSYANSHENVIRLDVAVDESKLVDSLNRKNTFGHIEAGNVFRERVVFDEHGHQVTTWQKLHKHVEERVVLEGCV